MDSSTYLKKLKTMECPDSTPWFDPPLVYEKALGSKVWSVEGTPYIDLCAGFGTLPLGHNHPAFKQVLKEVLEQNLVTQALGDLYPAKSKIDFIETLINFLPPRFSTAALSLSGAQAIEFAMKTAMFYTSREDFIVFDSGYHGLDFGSLSLTTGEFFRKPFEGWLNASKVKVFPYGQMSPELSSALKSKKVAAVVCEPIQGRGGMREGSASWLKELYQETKENGTLLIFDEVFTGMGRAGEPVLAAKHECDILCVGKAIGGGMPLSACVSSKEIMSSWPESLGEAKHTGTFFGHGLATAVGYRTLQTLRDEDLVTRSRDLGIEIKTYLESKLLSKPSVNQVLGKGLMLAIEGKEAMFGVGLMNQLRRSGVIAIPCGKNGRSLALTPSLNIPKDELYEAVNRIINLV
jgi:4-aminobutyrate aminotransferase/(S)-3-amino-2-methylpropionate transaminase